MKIPLLDLKHQYQSIRGEVERAIREVMESQEFILGGAVAECEAAIAGYCHASHAVGVSSGTDALLICLMAEGVGPGDEVITTPYTFFATAGCVARLGATPVFVDIDPVTYNLCTDEIEAKMTPRTRAIIPVHLFGQSSDMTAVMEIAEARGLAVIEDAAQAIGAEHRGRQAGSIGHYGCLSFYPSKNLAGAGDGGMVLTNDPERAEQLRRLRAHGSKPKYVHGIVGGNFRLDALQAAIVSAKLRHLDEWTGRRIDNAARYGRLFAEVGVSCLNSREWASMDWAGYGGSGRAPQVVLPAVVEQRHVFNQYVIRVAERDALRECLRARGIGSEIYYPVPMHLQECFAAAGIPEGGLSRERASGARDGCAAHLSRARRRAGEIRGGGREGWPWATGRACGARGVDEARRAPVDEGRGAMG